MTEENLELKVEEARKLVDRIGPSLGYDYTDEPVFPKNRKDVCVVRRMAENGSTYGFDTIYLVWKDRGIKYKELINSRPTKDYIHVKEVIEEGENIKVKVYSGGSYSGSPWEKEIVVNKKELNLK